MPIHGDHLLSLFLSVSCCIIATASYSTVFPCQLAVHPPDNVCYRGGGFDDQYRSFFIKGRKYRQPGFVATSFSRDVAREPPPSESDCVDEMLKY